MVRHALVTASYARRDVVGALLERRRPDPAVVRRRTRSLLGAVRLLPTMLATRRELRRRQLVPDAELAHWLVPR